MAVRDVLEVDGKPIKGREDLRALLAKREELRLVKQLTWRNSRYNLGASNATSTNRRWRCCTRQQADTAREVRSQTRRPRQ
jgi:hypothetical protein